MSKQTAQFTLTLDQPVGDITQVIQIRGTEQISDTFKFEVAFVYDEPFLPDTILARPATLQMELTALNGSVQTLHLKGIVSAVKALDKIRGDEHYEHIVVIEPDVSMLRLNEQNQVFATSQEMDIEDLINDLMAGTSKKASETASYYPSNIFDFEVRSFQESYPKKNFILQYFETDLDFLKRKCEHFGVHFFFDHKDGSSKMVFGDANTAFVDFGSENQENDGTIAYYQPVQGTAISDFILKSITKYAEITPSNVWLRDYTPDKSELTLTVDEAVDSNNRGVVAMYGEHFKSTDPNDGGLLAKVRAQEIACRQTVYNGVSNSPELRPGTIFKLEGHSVDLDDKEYLVIAASHSIDYFLSQFDTATVTDTIPYENKITFIPADNAMPFKPARSTPKPKVPGLITATIYGPDSDGRADIDDYGRYIVKLNMDESGVDPSQGSNRIRKSESYSGKGGMHFVCYADTECLLACINGDPDRPVIIGTVTNNNKMSYVTSSNVNEDVINFGNGITISAGTSS